ncbi:MAG: hypothetical protein P1U42_03755 [Phycisphaerales bacterium]|nr:hypothetical protein [Phycisphaerales bacterium]
MSKAITIAKFTLVFVVIAGGFALIFGTLMGGGLSRSYDELKGINNDPRSIFVQSILIETDTNDEQLVALPALSTQMSGTEFSKLFDEVSRARSGNGAHIRTPALLVQHSETGSISVKLGDHTFNTAVSPSVIDTKHGPVLRVAIQVQRSDLDSATTTQELAFETAYTAAPGSAILLDLADLGLAGTHAVLALRTTLVDPTPTSSN